MDTLDDIKAVMEDLNHRKGVLAEQMREFQQLQGEIQVLVEQSNHDPKARAKLEKLNQAFPEGIQNSQQAIMLKVTMLEENFKQLQEGFKAIGEEDNASGESFPKPKKKRYKNYM
ncbi:hypothetical protein [Vibrio aquimaris]|jgi:predicted  nucleic acid-binding Zn-ribbon protein|uniref:Uncharacterized protein n=1 Tax=Vibrio aquimaris TaxID=2587862 RepID=A0A5P9CKM9_9VIBR|nr:hypothetical protein [Vibrio aquimaris]QFT26247.1 hypothetical protein FIV01_07385 [Vibrio aquimaris]